ncbi:hypothetical protein H4R33_003529 [Dimargaris cristalligena]|uniref:Glycosyltransferase family 25-domain-containing protein n=1 Tax=Dimargaris cristalligena TaxID=215637 RepID=A0A4P9ZRE4_9FUNG|nr:hypothetical protein H4R33_003529 [Dimargaris cristalligena]RKP35010.1 glycosyltransferase family 25-domain-containing protein [Dimargaris cristalligena]|eukprot:RKP35010.1 glycosyltransferase family 25-domain-containing protein [Dimargaris cristalligena]
MRPDSYSLVEEGTEDQFTSSSKPRFSRRKYLYVLLVLVTVGGICILVSNSLSNRAETTAAASVEKSASQVAVDSTPSALVSAEVITVTQTVTQLVAPTTPALPVLYSHLGLDKIFLMNLPARTDRRDSMLEMGSFLHLDFSVFPATDKEEIKKDPLWTSGKTHLRDAQLACWKSHMRIYEEVIASSDINMALVLEDDVDIDYDIATKTKAALDAAKGEEWDMLYLGHCSGFEGQKQNVINKEANLYHADYPVCSHGYIVSKKGARKLLTKLAEPHGPIDLLIVGLTKSKELNVLALSPPIITQYHFAGDTSDINTDGKNGMTGGDLGFSTRKRLEVFHEMK